MTGEENETLAALQAVGDGIHKVFEHFEHAKAYLSVAAERNTQAWEHIKSDIPEIGPYMAQVIEASTFIDDYATCEHSEEDVRHLVAKLHDAAATLATVALKIHKFISNEGLDDNIAGGLRGAALELEDANRTLELHM